MTRLAIAWITREASCAEAMEMFADRDETDSFTQTVRSLLAFMIVAQAHMLQMTEDEIARHMAARCVSAPESPFMGDGPD